MLKWISVFIALIICTGIANADLNYAQVSPAAEVRGIWIDAGAIPHTECEIRDMVRSYHRANLNLLLPEVIARGYTVYPSKLLARDPRFAGAIDPLPIIIDEAHKLGMEVHPWMWVFRAGYTKDRGAILTTHPDWAELGKNGKDLSPNGGLWISPSIPEAREFLLNLFSELVCKYNVDGIHLDYIRYEVQSPVPYGYSQYSRDLFMKQYGIDPLTIDRLSFHQYEWEMFRERQVNSFVQSAALRLKSLKSNLIISAAVGSEPETSRTNLMQNWVNWVDNKWVDFITPMAYSDKNERFANLIGLERNAAGSKAIIAPGIGLHMQKTNVEQTVQQVGLTRERNASGATLFASSYFGPDQEKALSQCAYAKPASLPFRNPDTKCKELMNQAALLKSTNEQEAIFYETSARAIADYARYQNVQTGYIPPSPPPLNLPESVIPLPNVEVPKTTASVKIDGSLDDSAWISAAKVKLEYDERGVPAPVETTALLTYDTQNLYIAFNSSEPNASAIKAVVTKRDGPVFYDDSVEVFVDPTNQRGDYYQLSTNTIGTKFDQKVFNVSWNGEWETASKVSKDALTTEIAIPFSTLGIQTLAQGAQWALNLTRNRTVTGTIKYITWAVPYGSFHSPDRFGMITFR